MRRPTVLLFDIDGTLISAAGAGRRAMLQAFEIVTGAAEACTFSFDGMTDRAIARQALTMLGLATLEASIERILAVYIERLGVEILRANTCVHPGVRETLAAVTQVANVAVGLGTGNLKVGAQIKLRHAELDSFFSFGGYGCDHEERPAILRIGAQRGCAELGCAPEECRVVVIGDTPKDVAAALAIGADCVAIATGHFDVASLAATGAQHVFAQLTEPEALSAILDG